MKHNRYRYGEFYAHDLRPYQGYSFRQVQKGFLLNLKHPHLFRSFLMEHQYGVNDVSHIAPAFHNLPDYQDQVSAVQAPAVEAFYFDRLTLHVA